MRVFSSLTTLSVTPRVACITIVLNSSRVSHFARLASHLRIERRSTVRFQSTLALDMEKVNTTDRLSQLRTLMKERNLDVYSRLANTSTLSRTEISAANSFAVKLFLLKTATRLNTLPLVMLAVPSSPGSLVPLVVLSSPNPRLL